MRPGQLSEDASSIAPLTVNSVLKSGLVSRVEGSRWQSFVPESMLDGREKK
jgi:hypothetical protein